MAAVDRHVGQIGIGVKAGPIGEGELFRLDEQMQVLGRVVSEATQIVGFEQIEHLQGRDALAIGRQFPDVVATKVRRDRLDPGVLVFGEVAEGEVAADLLAVLDDVASDRPFVKGLGSAGGDCSIRRGEVGIAEDLADLWRGRRGDRYGWSIPNGRGRRPTPANRRR
ncbi:MAG: hypothetical protein R3C10_26955 [Pirellulales bacterium]